MYTAALPFLGFLFGILSFFIEHGVFFESDDIRKAWVKLIVILHFVNTILVYKTVQSS